MRTYSKNPAPDWAFNYTNPELGDISSHLRPDLNVSNTTLELGTDTVGYWYDLKDFKKDDIRRTSHTAHSAVNCSLIEVEEGQYWRWDKWNRTGPFSMKHLSHDLMIHTPGVNGADFGFG